MNSTDEQKSILPSSLEKRRIRPDILPGIFVVFIGLLLLLRQANLIDYPHLLFSWPVLLIAIGIFSGLKNNFKNQGWLVPVVIGTIFLADRVLPGLNLHHYLWPIIIIGFGLTLLLRPKRVNQWSDGNNTNPDNDATHPGYDHVKDSSDYIDTTAILGGVKNSAVENFRGGAITNFMGGTEINLTQADIQGVVTIDTSNIFGGTKLVIPSSWDVQTNVLTIFGGVDDKRQIIAGLPQPGKIVRLEGTCIFGGIEIRSY